MGMAGEVQGNSLIEVWLASIEASKSTWRNPSPASCRLAMVPLFLHEALSMRYPTYRSI